MENLHIKTLRRVIVITLTLGFFSSGFSQKSSIKNVEFRYTLKSLGESLGLKFRCLVPRDIGGSQRVISVNYSKNPSEIIEDNGKKYAIYSIDTLTGKLELKINILIEIYRRDLASSKKKPLFESIVRDSFLVEEDKIEISNAEILRVSKELSHADTLKTVKNIYNYVRKNIKYIGYIKTDLGAALALEHKAGDCSEITDLFVALCRANGIPSKVVSGVTTELANTPFHSWPEVYHTSYGWIRFDPTGTHPISFQRLRNQYIEIVSQRNRIRRWHYKCTGDRVLVRQEVEIVE